MAITRQFVQGEWASFEAIVPHLGNPCKTNYPTVLYRLWIPILYCLLNVQSFVCFWNTSPALWPKCQWSREATQTICIITWLITFVMENIAFLAEMANMKDNEILLTSFIKMRKNILRTTIYWQIFLTANNCFITKLILSYVERKARLFFLFCNQIIDKIN